MSYHKLKIHKHAVGSPYKIQEEFLEYLDAVATGNKIMAVQELSDLFGCIEVEIKKYGMTIEDLKVMSELTKEVFATGARVNEDFLTYLKRESSGILSWGLGFIQVKCGDINYNFYHKDVQKFASASSPHSHQKDFISEVIKGKLTETVYNVVEGSENSQTAYCACGNLFVEEVMLEPIVSEEIVHNQGDLYLREANEYHSVEAEHGTVTKVTKYGEDSVNAFVINDRETVKIQHIPALACWRMVEEVLNV